MLKLDKILLFILCFLATAGVSAQEAATLSKKITDKIQPIVGVQFWSVYSLDGEMYNTDSKAYVPVDNRLNTYLRRSRIGFTANPTDWLSLKFLTALDNVGHDVLSATRGGGNTGELSLLDMSASVNLAPKSDMLHLTSGFFRPNYGRESITSMMNVNSMEKSWVQNYTRNQTVGIAHGRAAGLNLGGMWKKAEHSFAISYDLGLFNPVYEDLSGNSAGLHAKPLSVGRLAFHIGDAETSKYGLGHKVNYFDARNGITVAFQLAKQGETAIFSKNNAYGVDILLNYAAFNLGGELHQLERTLGEQKSEIKTGMIRAGYNITLKKAQTLEPVIMYTWANGADDLGAQSAAKTVKMYAGDESELQFGLNWYIAKPVKITLHYALSTGNAHVAAEGNTLNDYYKQSGVGAIHRGDWLGLGMLIQL